MKTFVFFGDQRHYKDYFLNFWKIGRMTELKHTRTVKAKIAILGFFAHFVLGFSDRSFSDVCTFPVGNYATDERLF